MSFNSIEFIIFFAAVFSLYWFLARLPQGLKIQNVLIVIASYLFYGWWDWRFLSLLVVSTVIDFWVGVNLASQSDEKIRRLWLSASIIANLGLLGFFKYFNFFIESFNTAFSWLDQPGQFNTLNIILPVGISFYTFQTLSYSIDVYRKRIYPTQDFIAFAAYVSFFPQLVAGPIERASNLLPQFFKSRDFNYSEAVDGLRQILWGLFKKIVVADNCARYVTRIFDLYPNYSGSTLALGAVLFAFQIYGDFSGYSDIAIGSAKLLGFNLMQNFAYPYFSRDIAEFWRRWHISLSTWFRDYLYIPLGGSHGGKLKQIRNVFLVFLISGFWHGANWTFVLWGAFNAVLFLPLMLMGKNRENLDIVAKHRLLPSLGEVGSIVWTFIVVCLGWIIFRAPTLRDALAYFSIIFSPSFFDWPTYPYRADINFLVAILSFLTLMEWAGRRNLHPLEKIGLGWPRLLRWLLYYVILFFIFYFPGGTQDFVYFQF